MYVSILPVALHCSDSPQRVFHSCCIVTSFRKEIKRVATSVHVDVINCHLVIPHFTFIVVSASASAFLSSYRCLDIDNTSDIVQPMPLTRTDFWSLLEKTRYTMDYSDMRSKLSTPLWTDSQETASQSSIPSHAPKEMGTITDSSVRRHSSSHTRTSRPTQAKKSAASLSKLSISG